MKPNAAIAALAVVVTLVAGGAGPSPLGAQAPTPIRIGVSNSDVAAEPLYGVQTGMFRRAGLAATLSPGMQGGAVLRALRTGTIDVGFVNIISTASAVQQGDPVVLLAPGALYRSRAPLTVLVSAPANRIIAGAELNGKTIATPSGARDLGAIGTRAWIDADGGDSRTVHFVSGIPLAQVGAALAAHQIDASELTEPELSKQLEAKQVRVVAPTFDAVGSRFIIGGFVASKTWVRAHPDAARRFVRAMHDVAIWANAHRAETGPMLAASLGVDPQIVASMVRATYSPQLTPGEIQPALDVAARYGVLRPMKAATLIALP
jgi:ABC-type nitrate/sulfonate/bicarbonate transport system substrate-binding protein